jgi:hypothetical protein
MIECVVAENLSEDTNTAMEWLSFFPFFQYFIHFFQNITYGVTNWFSHGSWKLRNCHRKREQNTSLICDLAN